MNKEDRRLRIGVVGCGPIAQFAHFDACHKARNADLYAICDVADDLRDKIARRHEPQVAYARYADMLADPQVEAIVVAVADQFHVPLCLDALAAGKHVLVEKPLGVAIEECEALRDAVHRSGLVLQVGNNRRFDPGIAFTRRFAETEIGQRMSMNAWYYDSTYRYAMTDNLQPTPLASSSARRPAGNPKADKRRYFLLTHGSHLVDTARFLGGELASVRARVCERFGAYGWQVAVDFADGSIGNLNLIVAVRGDFEEGFQLHGEFGSAKGQVLLPWYHKTSVVECFSVKDGVFRRPLGEDAFTYKLQIEAFADTILHGAPQLGADVEDGLAAVRAMVAIDESLRTGESVCLADARGAVRGES